MPSALLAGTTGVVIYAASDPLAKGLQHAACASADYPLYGISDRHLVLLHALYPFAAMIVILPIAALPNTPIPLILLAVWTGVLILVRWKKRR